MPLFELGIYCCSYVKLLCVVFLIFPAAGRKKGSKVTPPPGKKKTARDSMQPCKPFSRAVSSESPPEGWVLFRTIPLCLLYHCRAICTRLSFVPVPAKIARCQLPEVPRHQRGIQQQGTNHAVFVQHRMFHSQLHVPVWGS